MYWMHLIFVLLYGVVTHWSQITASKPGYLDFDNLPETNFSCDKKVIGGYYADVETGCQMFHVCTIGQKGEITDIKFLCLNGTVFDQETRVCERIDEVDCAKSEDFFGLNLELYGNNANLGIQPENQFDCEDCSTDDDYEESEETTTFASSTTTTTTTPTPTTTTTTTVRPAKYQTSSQDTIAALLALHNAFNQGLQSSKVKPPPPRVINNAFSPTKSTPKPYTTYATQRSSSTFKPHNHNSDSQSFGSLNFQQQERPYYFTPTTERSNYQHFHSGDTSFGLSYDSTSPYNFQYFHSRKLPEVRGTISVVTSTSTSTSIRTSKGNTTIEYPTGYEDYQDDIHEVHDSFFADVPKIRQKRMSDIRNETQLQKPGKQLDQYYSLEKKLNAREEFLQNLLDSIDIEDRVREKMSVLFKNEETEMEKIDSSGGFTINLGNKLRDMIMYERISDKTDEIKKSATGLSEWKKHFEDMRKDINLNYTFENNLEDVEYKISRKKRETPTDIDTRKVAGFSSPTRRPLQRRTQHSTTTEQQRSTRRKVIRQKIDTEKFNFGANRRNHEEKHESKPVSEAIENDLTTVEYRKTSRRGREQPRATTSLRKTFKFDYEMTTAFAEPERRPTARPAAGLQKTRFRVGNHEQHTAHLPTAFITTPSPSPVRVQMTRTVSVQEKHNQHAGIATPAVAARNSSADLQKIRVHDEHHKQPTGLIPSTDVATDRPAKARLQPTRAARLQEEHLHDGFAPSTVVATTTFTPTGRRSRGRPRTTESTTSTTTTSQPLFPDPNFSCEGKVKGGFYADMYNDCKGFFICSQGMINGPLLKTHFLCGETTKFNQRSRTCQAESLVDCSVSTRYFHLNNDFLVPASEDELKGSFEPMRVS